MATSVDFDYNGPPVCVSNGMALQLVSQFGIRNAWHAFLRMRGMKVNSEESIRAVNSLKYFRNKIGKLRREIHEMKDKKMEGMEKTEDQMLGENFDTFLAAQNSLELREGVEEYPEVDEKEFEERTNETEEKAKEGQTVAINDDEQHGGTTDAIESDRSAEIAAASLVEKIREQQRMLNEQKGAKMGAAATLTNVAGTKKEEWRKKTTADERLRESGGEQKEGKNAQQLQDLRKEQIARRHAETIDDVVSLVLEKIRSNQPFEGELSMASASSPTHRFSSTMGSNSRGQKGSAVGQRSMATTSAQGKKLQLKEENAHGRGNQLQQQHFTAQPNEFSPLPSGQSIFFLHSPSGAQQMSSPHSTSSTLIHQPKDKHETHSSIATTSLSNLSEIIRVPSSNATFATPIHHQQTQSTVSGGAVQSQKVATTLLAQKEVSLQQPQQQIQIHPQHQHLLIGGASSSADLMGTFGGIPLDLAIQQGMTVQELIQTLKMQNRHQPIVFSQNQMPLQQLQQEVPDSSSNQEANKRDSRKFVSETLTEGKGTNKMANKGRKRKEFPLEKGEEEEQKKTHGENDATEEKRQRKGRRPKQQQTTVGDEGGQMTEEHRANEQQNERTEQLLSEMEVQLKKAQKQLTVERNKVMGQKKRADKLQTELDKNVDTIQLLQIDLACLKTDSNNLIAENIALKAENQKLRSKGMMSTAQRKSAPSAANGSAGGSAAGTLRGRRKANGRTGDGKKRNGKQKQLEKALSLPERTHTPPPLSSELGRRQSKRICVARTQFMKTLY